MNKPLRFGIVGTNFVSDSFMEGIQTVEDIVVSAVCSGRRENADRFASTYAIEHVFATYEELAISRVIDAVYIATPNVMHFQQASFFLNHKIPVFLEKPLCVNYKEAKALFELAKQNNTYLHDGIMPLYSPNLNILRDCINQIGPVRKVVLSFQKYSTRYDAYLRNENPTTFRRELANGAFMDLGIYTIADAVALFGKPRRITSSAYMLETGVDGLNTAILHYESFDVVVMNSKITNTKVMSEIQGQKGLIQFDTPSTLHSISMFDLKGEQSQVEVSLLSPFHHQLNDFKHSIAHGFIESSKVPHQLSLDIMEVLTECRLQAGIHYQEDDASLH